MKHVEEQLDTIKDEIADLQSQLKEAKKEQAELSRIMQSYNTGKNLGEEISTLIQGMIDGGMSKELAETVFLTQLKIVQSPFGGIL